MRALTFFAILFEAGQALAGECLDYSPIELGGVLSSGAFPGPPNYESVLAGDKPERYFFVVLAVPLCVRKGDTSGLEPAAARVRRVQLIFSDQSAYDRVRPFLGKEVRCTGQLIGGHTGHHHSEVVLTNSKCNAAQALIPPHRPRQFVPVR